MVHRGLDSFADKHIALLQGPVGPFFQYLAEDFRDIGATVYKINFNGGDRFFSSEKAIDYIGTLQEWGMFFTRFIEENQITTVILFGDCREYHRIAHAIAQKKGLDIGVFEEGYIRPDYITFEEYGVNGHSKIARNPQWYQSLTPEEIQISETVPVGNTFWNAAGYAIKYYFFSMLYRAKFRHYKHHRPLNIWEGLYWIRSLWRKWYYKIVEGGIEQEAISVISKNYFLVPLQISTDAQVREHSHFSSVENFIERVISSFAAHAPKETMLIIKHHPLDRGYHDYTTFIRRLEKHHHVNDRIKYIHDQHLPTLLEHARGVIVINSTVGLSAIHHNAPLKACGTAIYNIKGMTYQGTLEKFWKGSETFTIDRELYRRYKGYLINHKQINGSFYTAIKGSPLRSGILW